MKLPLAEAEIPQAPAAGACPNCGAPVPARFCGHCGQRNASRLVSVRRMVMDALDDQLTLNSALPRTLGNLLLHPGFLTREYVAGRVVRYIAPFRLYLVSSLIFFLTIAWITDVDRIGNQLDAETQEISGKVADSVRATGPDTATVLRARGATVTADPKGNPRFNLNMDTAGAGWYKPLARRVKQQEARLNQMTKGELYRTIILGMEQHAPKAVFLLLPVFALILKLLYVRHNRLYVEHFVFALHVHAFAFLLFTAMLVVGGQVSGVLWLWFLVYVFWAMRSVYGQSLIKTGLKYLTLGWMYFFLLVLGLVGTVIVAALTA